MPSLQDSEGIREQILADPFKRAIYKKIDEYVVAANLRRIQERGDYVTNPNSPMSLTTGNEDLKFLDKVVNEGTQHVMSTLRSDGRDVTEMMEFIKMQVMLDHHPLGPLFTLLDDPEVQEIRILGHDRCYYFVDDVRYQTKLTFASDEEVQNKVISYFSREQVASRQINQSNPIATIVLPDGSRCHIALNTVADPLMITIRKHQPGKFPNFEALAKAGAMPEWFVPYLRGLVKARYNMLFAGGVGCGKTTWLRAFGCEVGADERVGTIEDDRELFLPELRKDSDTFSLFSRDSNLEGKGGITMDILVRESLRMSADRILVGEVRGKEAHYMLQAMSSGFNGSACTIHAEMAEDTIPQLLRYILQHPDAGRNENLTMQTIGRVIHVVVFLKRVRTGVMGQWRKVLDHLLVINGYQNNRLISSRVIQYDENLGRWFWVSGRPSNIGDLNWRTRFANVGINPDDLIPNYILDEGSRYAQQDPTRMGGGGGHGV